MRGGLDHRARKERGGEEGGNKEGERERGKQRDTVRVRLTQSTLWLQINNHNYNRCNNNYYLCVLWQQSCTAEAALRQRAATAAAAAVVVGREATHMSADLIQ